MNQREKDVERWFRVKGFTRNTPQDHWADGADYGRKDLARRVLSILDGNGQAARAGEVTDLCQTILQDQEPAGPEGAPSSAAVPTTRDVTVRRHARPVCGKLTDVIPLPCNLEPGHDGRCARLVSFASPAPVAAEAVPAPMCDEPHDTCNKAILRGQCTCRLPQGHDGDHRCPCGYTEAEAVPAVEPPADPAPCTHHRAYHRCVLCEPASPAPAAEPGGRPTLCKKCRRAEENDELSECFGATCLDLRRAYDRGARDLEREKQQHNDTAAALEHMRDGCNAARQEAADARAELETLKDHYRAVEKRESEAWGKYHNETMARQQAEAERDTAISRHYEATLVSKHERGRCERAESELAAERAALAAERERVRALVEAVDAARWKHPPDGTPDWLKWVKVLEARDALAEGAKSGKPEAG